jgi:hypothetical protein
MKNLCEDWGRSNKEAEREGHMKHRIQNPEYRVQPSGSLETLSGRRGYDPPPCPPSHRIGRGGCLLGGCYPGRRSRTRFALGYISVAPTGLQCAAPKRTLEPRWVATGFYHIGVGFYRIGRCFYRISYRLLPDKWPKLPALTAYYRLLPHNVFFKL